jgi:3-oxoacyl-[acyl-carrier protein] reductase
MGNSIDSQVALVTGAAQGLGFAIAARLHGAGYRIVLSDRSLEAAQSAARDLDISGATVMPLVRVSLFHTMYCVVTKYSLLNPVRGAN